MMAYIILTGIAGLSFTAGWLMKSILLRQYRKVYKNIKKWACINDDYTSSGFNIKRRKVFYTYILA